MVLIKGLWKKKPEIKNEKKSEPKISFDHFSEKNIDRDLKVSSISIRVGDIKPFSKNVRLKYDDEDMDNLKQSIKNRSDIWNIDVYYITQKDEYVISDWHRTLKAYKELYWDDHKIEVIVRAKVPKMTPRIELQLMEIWFITSNTKKNLWFYEEAYSIRKYLDQLDKIEKEKIHKVSQKNIYEGLGLTKSKAMKYNWLLQKFSLEELSHFEDEEVSYKLLLELAKIKNQAEFWEIIDVIKAWRIESPNDLKVYNEIKEEIKEENNWNEEGVKENVIKEMDKVELRAEYKSVKSIKTASKKFCKELLSLEIDNLTEEEDTILKESIKNLQRIIKDKNL